MRINDVTGLLTSVVLDWDGMIANPNYMRNGNDISWNKYVPSFLSDPVTVNDIKYLVDERQYTFQIVEDGSLLQLYYSFSPDGDHVRSAKLAFYGYPINYRDTLHYGIESEGTDIVETPSPVGLHL